eukprot:1146433-Pelagomonas_calceolata.AAC.11
MSKLSQAANLCLACDGHEPEQSMKFYQGHLPCAALYHRHPLKAPALSSIVPQTYRGHKDWIARVPLLSDCAGACSDGTSLGREKEKVCASQKATCIIKERFPD